ncbi:tRNA CCA-pyrophosphorylase [Streptococcus criceti]|uniref:CCA-adding enzyme n=1 Tax=Streptococcus criceti HS-6 TaxID=873449 RepID=G5JPT5_STRCG|nr:CCA tRNA nucleotidyltransferase [Streptococcus criceti]EHI74530.1 putative tRNA adenylyltransferase [Streptococcus criceti HS-6]SUN43221.1 tRNA CCA-pyrophosphorylase [Streptococcus criceti]
MRLKNLPSEFQEALPVLEKIKSAGYEAYFVGGSVRDALLNRPIHDVDIATSSYPQETKRIFERTVDIGIEHGTVLVLENGGEYEVTTFRTEDVYVDYRRPKSVSFVRSLEEDLKRRDFTVNAFALAEDAQIVDLFDGFSDLENQVLRAVGRADERFSEDALRIMRGLRFAASLNFTIETSTFAAMKIYAPLLEKISVERSFIEFDKLLTAPYWKKGLEALIQAKACDYLPDLQGKADKLATLLTDYADDFVFATSEQAWAALCLALKIKNCKAFLKKWKTSSHFQKMVTQLVAIYDHRLTAVHDKQTLYRYSKPLAELAENLRQAQGLTVDFDLIAQLDASLLIHHKKEIVVNGGDLMAQLGLRPGPALGQVLNQIEAAIVQGELANEREAILAFAESKIE